MMIFTRLELKNFKSHADTTLDFNPGISLIVGENGAGKSSIFEAISFALFKSYTTKSINDLVRSNKNTGDKIQMVVKLSFVSNGTEYEEEAGAGQGEVYGHSSGATAVCLIPSGLLTQLPEAVFIPLTLGTMDGCSPPVHHGVLLLEATHLGLSRRRETAGASC